MTKTVFGLLFLLLLTNISISQTQDHLIINNNSDTLINLKILKYHGVTNGSQVTFKKNGRTSTLKADEILAYWDGKSYFTKKRTKSEQTVLLEKLLPGPLTLAYRVKDNGDLDFLIRLEDEESFTLLNENEFLNQLKESGAIRFLEFMDSYEGRIEYNRKDFGNLISRYNEFINPEKYQAVRFTHQDNVKLVGGLALGCFDYKFPDFDLSGMTPSIHFGILMQYSPQFYMRGSIGLMSQVIKEGENRIIYKRAAFEVWPMARVYDADRFKILVGPGVGMDFKMAGSVRERLTQTTLINQEIGSLKLNYSANVYVKTNRKKRVEYGFFASVKQSKVGYVDSISSVNNVEKEGVTNIYRVGLEIIY
ncbi:hypothetical protein AAOE16_05390 [Ekhidna sp. MALMAid0563]|uniref:hypothetical protein n=1 Tax=Ekhidna sp. MALMAid0563 TaxID=3143937 RepID=UPI0032DEC52C